MTTGRAEMPGGEPAGGGLRRVVCVAVNASVDKIAAVARLVPGEIHRPELLSVVPGGKAVNVARAATRLELEAVVVPVVAGHAGAWLVEALAVEGIRARAVTIEGETRTCLTILDRSTGRLTEVYEPGPPLGATGWARLEAAVTAELAADGARSVVVMSGSLPPGAPDDGYARLVTLARRAGARSVVDADGAVLARAIAARPWLVRVNADEAARATGQEPGGEAQALAAARALRADGAVIALITRGVEGAVLVDEHGAAWRVGPPPEHGQYPVGSGDSFLAGFLRGIGEGVSTAQAARLAIAAGAANALHPGQGAVDPADVARIRPRVALARFPVEDPPSRGGAIPSEGRLGRGTQPASPAARSELDTPTRVEAPVDPAAVPRRTLPDGAQMPAIGLGTFGSDRVAGDRIAAAVYDAIRLGYRHIDCAAVYGNEHLIGEAFERAIADGVSRDDLWITSKLWNDSHAPAAVAAACERTLRDLRLEALDLYLVHWPFPNTHAPGVAVSSRDTKAQPYLHEQFMATWGAMEHLVERGLVRHVGTSNMTIPKLRLLLRDARIRPVANEMELHPHFQQPELFEFVRANGLIPIGFAPVGSPARPDRDRTPDDSVDVEDPVIVAIARRLGVHPAVVCVKWAIQRGQVPIPFSTTPANYLANLRAASSDPLPDEDMRAIAAIDRNCRLIKGQVFLWKAGQSWEDLWDLDGTITPP